MNTTFRLTLFSLWLLTSQAFAAQKVALVIGNSQYQNVQDSLKNPVNDAKAIAERFKELGFDTEMLPNANLDTMLEAINRARSKVDTNGTLVFYYAGHGVQLDGKNYLVPVDARMANPDRVQRETIQVKEVIDKFNDSSAAVRVLMLDACRNDPFPKAHRSGTRGLAREELQLNKGMMVLYAASQGEVAEDGAANHGTFTDALLRGLSQPNIKLPELMDDVTTQVQQKTQNKQNPYYEGTGLSRFVLVPATPVVSTPIQPAQDAEITFWNSIATSTDASDYAEYLKVYPNGKFSGLAQSRKDKYSVKPQQLAQVQVRDKPTPQASQSNTDEELMKKGMWRDPKTNLVWMRCSLGQTWNNGIFGNGCKGKAKEYTWQEALDAAKAFNNNGGFGGNKDWVVPHIEDLSSIRYCSTGFKGVRETGEIPTKAGGTKMVEDECKDEGYQRPTINQTIFPNTEDSAYWSSSTVATSEHNAWIATFYNGGDYYGYKNKYYYVRLVRSSQ